MRAVEPDWPPDDPGPPDVGSLDVLRGMRNGSWLDAQEFPPLQYVVPGIVSEGLGLVAGPPKVGKSWFVTGLALAVAAARGIALGRIPVQQRPVLYQALEDGDRRMQHRCRQILANQPIPDGFNYITKAKTYEVIPMIMEFLARHPGRAPLVILDTLGKVKPPKRPGEDPYSLDYAIGSQLKDAIDSTPGASLLVVHHTRKADSSDFVDTVSGTHGIAGAADFILVLSRKRHQNDALLAVTGRDIVEAEYALRVDDGIWQLDGPGLEAAAVAARERREQGQLGDRALEVVAFVNGRKETRAADLTEISIDQAQARVYLNRLADSGRILKTGRGLYTGVTTNTGVTSNGSNRTQISLVTSDLRGLSDTPQCKCGAQLVLDESLKSGQCMECWHSGGGK